MVENNEYQEKCAYCVNGSCVNPKAEGEKAKLETLINDASFPLEQLNRTIDQSMHMKNLATRLDVENDDVLYLPYDERGRVVNEAIMDARSKIKFNFFCFAHPKRNPCKSRKLLEDI
jgi:hypothetical protein